MLNLGQPLQAGDEEETEIDVGDGFRVDRRLFTFKILVFDM